MGSGVRFRDVLALTEGSRRVQISGATWFGRPGPRQYLGDLDGAMADDQQALTIQREVGNRTGQRPPGNIGVRAQRARWTWTPPWTTSSRLYSIQQEVGDRAGEASTLSNIGPVHSRRGDLDTALDFYGSP